MVAQRVHRAGGVANAIHEVDHPGQFMVSEYGNVHCRGNLTVEGGANGVRNNSVLADGAGDFRGIVFEGVKAGQTASRAAIVRGPCEVSLAKLVFPVVTNAPDGPDSGSDNTAENAVATTALRTALIADMRAAGIVVVG